MAACKQLPSNKVLQVKADACYEVVYGQCIICLMWCLEAADVSCLSLASYKLFRAVCDASPTVLAGRGIFGSTCWHRARMAERALFYEGFGANSLVHWHSGPNLKASCNSATITTSPGDPLMLMQAKRWLQLAGGTDGRGYHGIYRNIDIESPTSPSSPRWLSFSLLQTPEATGACMSLHAFIDPHESQIDPPILFFSCIGDELDKSKVPTLLVYTRAGPLTFKGWRQQIASYGTVQENATDKVHYLGEVKDGGECRVAVHFRWKRVAEFGGTGAASNCTDDGVCSVYVDGVRRAKHLPVKAPRGIGALALFNVQTKALFSDICLGFEMPPEVFKTRPAKLPPHGLGNHGCHSPSSPNRRPGPPPRPVIPKSPKRGSRVRSRQQWSEVGNFIPTVLAVLIIAVISTALNLPVGVR